jgi:hypothetical protein
MMCLLLSLQGRENPFFPSKGENDIPYSSNQPRVIEPLKQSSITLPSTARKIKKVTIEYVNMDASIESRSISLDNSIDWHLPIFISQNYTQRESKDLSSVVVDKKFKKIASIKHAIFYSMGKKLKIVTDDEIIRNFLLVMPHRLVIDFKKDTNLKSYIKNISQNIFTKVRIGNHAGYYRAVIELDGHYRYKIEKISNGYLIILR